MANQPTSGPLRAVRVSSSSVAVDSAVLEIERTCPDCVVIHNGFSFDLPRMEGRQTAGRAHCPSNKRLEVGSRALGLCSSRRLKGPTWKNAKWAH